MFPPGAIPRSNIHAASSIIPSQTIDSTLSSMRRYKSNRGTERKKHLKSNRASGVEENCRTSRPVSVTISYALVRRYQSFSLKVSAEFASPASRNMSTAAFHPPLSFAADTSASARRRLSSVDFGDFGLPFTSQRRYIPDPPTTMAVFPRACMSSKHSTAAS